MSSELEARGRWVRRGMIWHFIGERPKDTPISELEPINRSCSDCGAKTSRRGITRCWDCRSYGRTADPIATLIARFARNFAAHPAALTVRICDDCGCLTHDQEDCPGCVVRAVETLSTDVHREAA